jgi:hypothetical protein
MRFDYHLEKRSLKQSLFAAVKMLAEKQKAINEEYSIDRYATIVLLRDAMGWPITAPIEDRDTSGTIGILDYLEHLLPVEAPTIVTHIETKTYGWVSITFPHA